MKSSIHNDQLNSGESAGNSEELWSATATETFATLIEEIRKVDVNAPLAKLNATSISDNNGSRILL